MEDAATLRPEMTVTFCNSNLLYFTVSKSIRSCSVFMLGDGCVHTAQSMLRGDQETRVSSSGGGQTIHEKILSGTS